MLTSALSWDESAGIPLPSKVQVSDFLGECCYSPNWRNSNTSSWTQHCPSELGTVWTFLRSQTFLDIWASPCPCWSWHILIFLSFTACAEHVLMHPGKYNSNEHVYQFLSTTVSQAKRSSLLIVCWSHSLGSIFCPWPQFLQLRTAMSPVHQLLLPSLCGVCCQTGLWTVQSELLFEAYQAVLIPVSWAEPGPKYLSLFPVLPVYFLALTGTSRVSVAQFSSDNRIKRFFPPTWFLKFNTRCVIHNDSLVLG